MRMEQQTRSTLVAGGTLALVLGALGVWMLARDPGTVPVMVGGDPMLDACSAIGVATDGSVAVRTGPGDQYPIVDELEPGAAFSVCGDSAELGWRAIVYRAPEQAALDCGVATPIASATRYAGPCRSGWVKAVAIQTIAG